MTEYALCYYDEETGEWAAMDTRMVESRKAALATLPEVMHLQQRIAEYQEMHAEMSEDLNTHRAECVSLHRQFTLSKLQWDRWKEYALELNERLQKYEPGAPMLLNNAAPSPEDKP